MYLNLVQQCVPCYLIETCIGEKRCNYEAIARGVVSVVGLPTDLALKHPRMYGRGALKRILENKEELKFLGVFHICMLYMHTS